MNTLSLLTTSGHLQAAEPDMLGGLESLTRRFIGEDRARTVSSSNEESPVRAPSQTVGLRVACRSVVRWYHGGINE